MLTVRHGNALQALPSELWSSGPTLNREEQAWSREMCMRHLAHSIESSKDCVETGFSCRSETAGFVLPLLGCGNPGNAKRRRRSRRRSCMLGPNCRPTPLRLLRAKKCALGNRMHPREQNEIQKCFQ
eukprot:3639465-Amphidinium_carterae.3